MHDHRRAAEHLNVDVHQELRQPEQPAPEGHADVRAGFLLLRQGDGADDGHQQAEIAAQRRARPRNQQGHARSAQEQHPVFFQQKGHPA